MPGLDEPPFDNHPLGQRIYENVSKEAWKMWLEQMKMIMNEYRLNLGTQEAQEFLLKQMEDYFFGAGAALPPGYVPPASQELRSFESPATRLRFQSAIADVRSSQRLLHGIREFRRARR
jgi:Fe-S cluster biosynthesis and repair protein YggX